MRDIGPGGELGSGNFPKRARTPIDSDRAVMRVSKQGVRRQVPIIPDLMYREGGLSA